MVAGNRERKQVEKWVFTPDVILSCSMTKQHPQAYIKITEILSKEHFRRANHFSQEKALYLELAETELAKNQKRCKKPIVDFSIGISKGKNRMIRLVEAKFDVDNLKNLTESNIPEKVKHSNDIFISNGIPIKSGAVVLINNSKIVQQQKRWLSSILAAKGQHYSVRTVEEFYNEYFKVS